MQNATRLSDFATLQQQSFFQQQPRKGNQAVKTEASQIENESFLHNVSKANTIQPLIVDETKQYMDGLIEEEEDSDGEGEKLGKTITKKAGKKTRGRVKIKMEFIQNKLRRYTTFSKRKTGIMKKAYELSTLTGTQVMLLVASETGHVYTFATRKLQPMITSESGKALIQTCLNSPDPTPPVIQDPQVQQAIQSQQIQAIAQPLAQQIIQSAHSIQNNAQNDQVGNEAFSDNNLQFQTNEELKIVQTSSPGSIQYVQSQGGQSFPITTYIAPASQVVQTTKQQQVGSITTIFTPAGGATSNNNSTVALQANVQQPQIISGQLQLHRIHPQNIILTGNGPCIQQNHIILNQGGTSQATTSLQQVSPSRSESNAVSSQQEIIAVVNPHQMVYNSSGNVIYATRQPEPIFKRPSPISGADQLSLQHTPVIQASGERHQIIDGEALIVPRTQNDMK